MVNIVLCKDACVVSCARVVIFLAVVCIALCKKGDWLDTHGATLLIWVWQRRSQNRESVAYRTLLMISRL